MSVRGFVGGLIFCLFFYYVPGNKLFIGATLFIFKLANLVGGTLGGLIHPWTPHEICK